MLNAPSIALSLWCRRGAAGGVVSSDGGMCRVVVKGNGLCIVEIGADFLGGGGISVGILWEELSIP
jgi:hypothetical protein